MLVRWANDQDFNASGLADLMHYKDGMDSTVERGAMVTLPTMRVSSRPLLAIVLVAIAFLGPVALAFDACAAMSLCEAPCALSFGVVFAMPVVSPPVAVSDAVVDCVGSLPAAPCTVLKPPPKFAALSL